MNRLDEFCYGGRIDFFTEIGDKNIYYITHSIEIIVPNMFGDHSPADDLTFVTEQ